MKIVKRRSQKRPASQAPGAGTISIVSSKYQVVIPRQVRKAAGIEVGDRLAFIPLAGGLQVVKVPDIRESFGLFPDLKANFDRERDNGERAL